MKTFLIPYQGDLYRITLDVVGDFLSATVKPNYGGFKPEPVTEDDIPYKVLKQAQNLFNESGI